MAVIVYRVIAREDLFKERGEVGLLLASITSTFINTCSIMIMGKVCRWSANTQNSFIQLPCLTLQQQMKNTFFCCLDSFKWCQFKCFDQIIKHFKLFRARGHGERGKSSKLTCSFFFCFFFFFNRSPIIQINLCIWFAEAHIWIVEWWKLSFFSRTAIKTKTDLSKFNVLIRKGKLKSYSSAFWFLHILGLSEVSCHLNRLGWVKSNENSECCDLSSWP